METLQVLVMIFGSGFLGTALGYLIKSFNKKRQDDIQTHIGCKNYQNLVRNAVEAILRDRLNQKANYHLEAGFAHEDDKTVFNEMYIAYHALGLNGVMDSKAQRFLALPHEKEE